MRRRRVTLIANPSKNYSENKKPMEQDSRLPTGEWTGFYLETHRVQKGWMHLYLSFENGRIRGEGTDYVGPWTASGTYAAENGVCTWVKQYLGKHQVKYDGIAGEHGIQGEWTIGYVTGQFHIWPKSMSYLNEMYLQEEFDYPIPSIPLGGVPVPSEDRFV